jgi:hypothetical protein
MQIPSIKRILINGAALRRVSEIIDFVTYREVREFDFARVDPARKARRTAAGS